VAFSFLVNTCSLVILAFAIAAFISALELITSKYPQTYFLLLAGSRSFYTYAIVYGVIAAAIVLGLDALVSSQTVKLEGLGLSSPWIRATAVGLTVKAFLHINLFNVTIGSQSMPVGVESFVQLFEPALLRGILLDEFNAVRNYIHPYAVKYSTLADNKARIKGNIPPSLLAQERAAFENDVDKAGTVTEAMEFFLRFLGRKTFNRVFPL
jgi:hypothetical protein